MSNNKIEPRVGLSYLWSAACIIYIGYILFMWGHEKEILTLIIGFISGTVGGSIFGFWFAGNLTNKNHALPGTTIASIQADVTTTPIGDNEPNNNNNQSAE
jgi:hypothetical protein